MMSTLTKNKYNRLSKEELILLLEARDNERKADTGSSFAEASNIKRIISEVLVLLFNEERQPNPDISSPNRDAHAPLH